MDHPPPGDLLSFLAVAALVIVTPGQDTALTIRNTLAAGRRGGSATALGVSSGQAVWAIATSFGLAAVLTAWAPLFSAIRLLGAAYLVFLGAQALISALRGPGSGAYRSEALPHVVLRPATAYRQGLLSNLGNPKMAVFFTSLLPQFAPPGSATFAGLLGLGLVFCTMTLAWLTAYSVVIARAGQALRRPGLRRALDAVLGSVLVALGLRLATEPS